MGVKRPLLLLPRPLLLSVLPLYNRLLLSFKQLTTTMLMHQLILTSTHSSTLTTPLTVTSDSTVMQPTLDQTKQVHSPMAFLLVLTVPESILLSTLLMLLIVDKSGEEFSCC